MNQSKGKYLLTGAGGFLGQTINSVLIDNGVKVIGPNLFGRDGRIDIIDPFEFDPSLIVDVVVHAAGKAHSMPKTPDEEDYFYKVNYDGTRHLCRAIENLQVKPKSFIFISTVAVYGVESGLLIEEGVPLLGNTAYAKSKILAEVWLKEWSQNIGVKLGILRLPLVVGPTPPGNLGTMIEGIRSGKYFRVGKGDARKSMVWCEDIGSILPVLAELGGTYNLTDGHHPTFKELEYVISDALAKKEPVGIPLAVAKLLAKIGDLIGERSPINTQKLNKITSTLTFDDSKARNELGWNPSSVLEKLRETL